MNNKDINQSSLDYLKKLPIKKLRKRQDIVGFQIKLAHKKNLTDVIERLLLMQEQLDQAVWYVAFGTEYGSYNK